MINAINNNIYYNHPRPLREREEFQFERQQFFASKIRNSGEGLQTLKQEFPSLQIPCQLRCDKFEKTPEFATQLPSGNRNYTIVNPDKVNYFVNQKEKALPYIADVLIHSNNEAQITETLYILNSMLDNGTKDVEKMYPVLARFNNTTSPNIQTFLAGIYRKIQVPDAFGPLVKMLIQNSMHPQTSNFDPNEEIGGAILSYLNPRFRGEK